MVSEVQVDDERVARELLKDDQRSRGRGGGARDRWGLMADGYTENTFHNKQTKNLMSSCGHKGG